MPDCFIIHGGQELEGEVGISGSKNAVLPIMAASLLSSGKVSITRVPNLTDVDCMIKVLSYIGARVNRDGDNLCIDSSGAKPVEIPDVLMRSLRASNLVLGSLLARFGEARIPFPGGCEIGTRPMDIHLNGLKALGAEVIEEEGFIQAHCDRLQGSEIVLDFPSVGATENLMMAATRAVGTTIIRNAAREPEIVDLARFLQHLGAKVRGAGGDTVRIDGVDSLGETVYAVMPDRIEAGTYLIAAAAAGKEVVIKGAQPRHIGALLSKLREAGIKIKVSGTSVIVSKNSRPQAVNLRTLPYPGFPTDLHPQMVAFLTMTQGIAVVTETIFENRMRYVLELCRLGANARVVGQMAVIMGQPGLSGARVRATDLRAGAALVIAGLMAEGETIVEGTEHIDRGYEDPIKKYRTLGADISRERCT